MTLRTMALSCCLGAGLWTVGSNAVRADTYHLQDGGVVQGQELSRDAKGLKVETPEGVRLIPWTNLARISPDDETPSQAATAPSPGGQGIVTVHLKNGQLMRGRIVDRDEDKLVLESKGVKLTISQSDVESIEEFTSLPPQVLGGSGFSGADMMKQLPAEIARILQEMGERCKDGFQKLNAFSGHIVMKVDFGSLAGPSVVPAGTTSFSAEADVWSAKGGRFRMELSAKDPKTGGLLSVTVASNGQTALGRLIVPGEQEEQYFTLDVNQFRAMAEQTAATQTTRLQPQQMDQLEELAQEMTVTKGEPGQVAAGMAEPYRMNIATGEIPNLPSNMAADSVQISVWIGVEDDLPYRVDVGMGGLADLLVLELTRIDRNPRISDQLFTIQVPDGVVPQDVGQMLGMGMMGAMGNMGGMGAFGGGW